jgi:hypothetical protein
MGGFGLLQETTRCRIVLALCDYTGIAKILYDWQTVVAGIGAVVAAVATIIVTMCSARRQVAAADRQTDAVKEQNADLRRQHEDEFRPICMLVPYDGVDPWYQRRDLLVFGDDDPPNPRFGKLKLNCFLRNIGHGPATDVKIMLRLTDKGGRTTEAWELAPLTGGESRGSGSEPLCIPIYFNDEFARNDVRDSVNMNSWQIILCYRSISRESFHSIHHAATIEAEKYYAPPYVAVRQPWVTFGRGEPC